MSQPYQFGLGKLYFRPADDVGAAWQSFGDLSSLLLSAAPLAGGRTENWSGNRGRLPGQQQVGSLSVAAVAHALHPEALAELTSGDLFEHAAGAVVGYVLPSVGPGSNVRLPHLGVSDLVMTDGVSATIEPAHYDLDSAFGSLEIVSLPASPVPTPPLRVSYRHAASRSVGLLERDARPLELRYEGVNLAAANAPVVLELWRVELDRLKEMPLVEGGAVMRGVPISGDVLLDTARTQPGMRGGFGRITQGVTG